MTIVIILVCEKVIQNDRDHKGTSLRDIVRNLGEKSRKK